MGRAPCCDKATVKRGPWSAEEDARLKSYIKQHGTGGNWIALPQKIGLKRCGKSCRLRWLNYLRPDIRHGGFSEEEDRIICSLYIAIGSRWSVIAAQLPGRTDNDIKNYWNTRLKKKLFGKQQKEQKQQQPANVVASPASNQIAYNTSSNILVGGLDVATMDVVDDNSGGSFSAMMSGESTSYVSITDHEAFRTELDEIFRFSTAGKTSSGGLDHCLYQESVVTDESTVTSSASESVNWYDQSVALGSFDHLQGSMQQYNLSMQ